MTRRLSTRIHGFTAVVLAAWCMSLPQPATALDDAHWAKANDAINQGIAYLQSTQGDDGSWSPQPGPAVTAMILGVMLDRTDIATNNPAVKKALDYVLSQCQADGGIHDGILENYNTAICLAALAKVHDRPGVGEVIQRAQKYLGQLQWSETSGPQDATVQRDHPYYGGAGYGKHGRPDMSNTQMMLEGLYESGMDCNDPIFQRALVFITRCQGTASNELFKDKIIQDGGFIYATSINKDLVGVPQSMASPDLIDAAKRGEAVNGLRTYGSMTYAGFKSYLYANLDRDDPRVTDAYDWIRHHFTVKHNPGMPDAGRMQGYYYYLMTFSRALDAWGASTITASDDVAHDWANELIDQLARLQRPDGSWVNESDRWMESDPNLATAYALIALTHAIK